MGDYISSDSLRPQDRIISPQLLNELTQGGVVFSPGMPYYYNKLGLLLYAGSLRLENDSVPIALKIVEEGKQADLIKLQALKRVLYRYGGVPLTKNIPDGTGRVFYTRFPRMYSLSGLSPENEKRVCISEWIDGRPLNSAKIDIPQRWGIVLGLVQFMASFAENNGHLFDLNIDTDVIVQDDIDPMRVIFVDPEYTDLKPWDVFRLTEVISDLFPAVVEIRDLLRHPRMSSHLDDSYIKNQNLFTLRNLSNELMSVKV